MADTNKKYRERRRIAENLYRKDVGFFSGWSLSPEKSISDEVLEEYAYEVTYTPSYLVWSTGERVVHEPRTYMTTRGAEHVAITDMTQEEYYELEEKAREEHIRSYYKEGRNGKNYGRSEKEYRKTYNRKRRRKEKELCRQWLYEGETERTNKLEGEIESCDYGIAWDMW